MIKYAYTILYVKDVAKSILFYEKAFAFKRKFITPANEYGELITGETTLSFAAVSLAKTNCILRDRISYFVFATNGYAKANRPRARRKPRLLLILLLSPNM